MSVLLFIHPSHSLFLRTSDRQTCHLSRHTFPFPFLSSDAACCHLPSYSGECPRPGRPVSQRRAQPVRKSDDGGGATWRCGSVGTRGARGGDGAIAGTKRAAAHLVWRGSWWCSITSAQTRGKRLSSCSRSRLLKVRHRCCRTPAEDDAPMARKASLQRFMEMRKGRVAMLSLPSLLCRPWHRFAATLRPFTHSRQVSISHMPCR